MFQPHRHFRGYLSDACCSLRQQQQRAAHTPLPVTIAAAAHPFSSIQFFSNPSETSSPLAAAPDRHVPAVLLPTPPRIAAAAVSTSSHQRRQLHHHSSFAPPIGRAAAATTTTTTTTTTARPALSRTIRSPNAITMPPRRGFGGKKKGEAARPQQQKRPPLTHFLCMPLVTAASRPQLEEALGKFRGDVVDGLGREEERERGDEGEDGGGALPVLPAKAVRPVGTLHLTLGVMSLTSAERVQEAVRLLQGLDLAAMVAGRGGAEGEKKEAAQGSALEATAEPDANASKSSAAPTHDSPLDSEPLVIAVKSLVSMHPAQKTSILYAQPEDPTGRLHPFCNELRNVFTEKGLMVEDTRPLKLHATVVNTIYAKMGGRHGKGKGRGQPAKDKAAATEDSTANAGETTTVSTLLGESSAAPPDTSSGHGPNARAPIRIDATALLPRYADFVWADGIRVGKIAICKMGAKKITGSQGDVVGEEYEEVASAEVKL